MAKRKCFAVNNVGKASLNFFKKFWPFRANLIWQSWHEIFQVWSQIPKTQTPQHLFTCCLPSISYNCKQSNFHLHIYMAQGCHPSFYQPCHKNIHNILLSLGFYCICKFLPYRNFSNALIDNLKLRKYAKNFWQMETFQCIVWRGKLCGRKWNHTYCTDPSEQTINIL